MADLPTNYITSMKKAGGLVTVTISPVKAEASGKDATGFGEDFKIEKIAKVKDKVTQSPKDGKSASEKKDAGELKDRLVESNSKSHKVKNAAPGDWPEPEEVAPDMSADVMTDLSLGKKFKPKSDKPKSAKKSEK